MATLFPLSKTLFVNLPTTHWTWGIRIATTVGPEDCGFKEKKRPENKRKCSGTSWKGRLLLSPRRYILLRIYHTFTPNLTPQTNKQTNKQTKTLGS